MKGEEKVERKQGHEWRRGKMGEDRGAAEVRAQGVLVCLKCHQSGRVCPNAAVLSVRSSVTTQRGRIKTRQLLNLYTEEATT